MRVDAAFDVLQDVISRMFDLDEYKATELVYAVKAISEYVHKLTVENDDLRVVIDNLSDDIGTSNIEI